jgi:hypothetical protein
MAERKENAKQAAAAGSAADTPESPPPRRFMLALLFVLGIWAATAFWQSVKPLPPGTRVSSLGVRLSESQVELTYDAIGLLANIDRAEQAIVLDQCPLARDVAQHLLARKRQRPNLKIVLITDPVNEAYGGTPAQHLATLEQAGIIVVRVRLERLRDSNPLYSALWRLGVGWWSDPYDEAPGQLSLRSTLRQLNYRADRRQLMVTDDGSGGWLGMITGGGSLGIQLRGGLARDMAASELDIAAWSTGEDRLPALPPPEGRGLGSIDARFLTEGAIRNALLDALATAGGGDLISIAVRRLSDRALIDALLRAAQRGAQLRIALDAAAAPNLPVAAELMRAGQERIEVRWMGRGETAARTPLTLIQHRGELWADLGGADYSRPSLEDFNLTAAVELRLPVRAAAARALLLRFAALWTAAEPGAPQSGDSSPGYWRYRALAASGLAGF